jgi:hypothetical protein
LLAPEIGFDRQRGRLFYHLDGATADVPGAWGYVSHRLGVTYRRDFTRDGRMLLFFGMDGTLRRNGTLWENADFNAWGGFINVELRAREGATLRSGLRLDDRTVPETSALSHAELAGFVSLNLNFETRTTLIAEARRGFKSYSGGTLDAATDMVTVFDDTVGPPGSSNSHRRSVAPGRIVAAEIASLPAALAHSSAIPSARAFATTWLVRAAQSLAERTGLSIQYQRRNSTGDVPPVLFTLPQRYLDDGIYDDPYASELRAWWIRLKHVLPSGMIFDVHAGRDRRQYVAAPALDAEGKALPERRLDRLSRAGMDVSFPLLSKQTGVGLAMAFEVQYSYLLSRSNDGYYDYRSHVIDIGLRIEY